LLDVCNCAEQKIFDELFLFNLKARSVAHDMEIACAMFEKSESLMYKRFFVTPKCVISRLVAEI
jgi:hypothetical protein